MNRDNTSGPANTSVLLEELEKDIDALSERELRAEAEDAYGSIDNAIKSVKSALEAAIQETSNETINAQKSTVFELSLDKKRSILEKVARHFEDLGDPLTAAARNEKDLESDLDSLLEDLIELEIIDRDGNLIGAND